MSAWSSCGTRRGIVLAVVGPLLVVAACGSSPKRGGTIEGTAMPCGPFTSKRVTGTVTVTVTDHAGTEVARQTVGPPYHFRFGVKDGEYFVSAPAAAPKRVHVQPGQTASVALISTCL
jgi:hypothetical protein